MGWDLHVVRFDLGPLILGQSQTRIGKVKSAYNLHIIGPRSLQCETNFKVIGNHGLGIF